MRTSPAPKNSLSRGSQVIDLSPLRIELPLELTIMSASINKDFNEEYYTVIFGGNKVLRSMMIYVTTVEEHVRITEAAWGQLVPCQVGKVAEILKPVFHGVIGSFLKNQSRNPSHVGALLNFNGRFVLLSFHIYRGAVNSKDLPLEVSKSLRLVVA